MAARIIGAVALLLGGFLLLKALLPPPMEKQAQYLSGLSSDLKVQLTHPTRLLVGKTGRVSLTFQTSAEMGSAEVVFDRQLDLEGFAVRPQKRLLTRLETTRSYTEAWKVEAFAPTNTAGTIGMAVVGEGASGMIALTPQSTFAFSVEGYNFLGMGYTQAIRNGLLLLALGIGAGLLGFMTARKGY